MTNTRLPRSLLSFLIALSAMLATPLTAEASDGNLRVKLIEAGVALPLRGPLFEEFNLEPGIAINRNLRLSNESRHAGRLTLDVNALRQFELGCTETELEAGDSSCASAEGELQSAILATISMGEETLYSGPLDDMHNVMLAEEWLQPGRHLDVGFAIVLPRAVSNLVQTDSVEFDLRWTLTAPDGEVLGTQVIRPGSLAPPAALGVADSSGPLADTGARVSLSLLLMAALLVTTGTALAGRSMRERPAHRRGGRMN